MSFAIVVKETGELVQRISGVNPVIWPNGDASHGGSSGMEYREWKVVPLTFEEPPTEFHYSDTNYTPDFDGEKIVMRSTFIARDLQLVRTTLNYRIDEAAEALRQRYVSPGAGQAMVYLQKRAEAVACAKEQDPDPADYPLLAATIGIEGDDLLDVANLVLETSRQWAEVAAAIEAVRLGAKAGINEAADIAEAIAAFQSAHWPP